MRAWPAAAIVIVLAMAVAAPAQAEDPAEMRQELVSLKTQIERIDADLDAAAQQATDLNQAAETYRHQVEESSAASARLGDARQQMTSRKERLDAEHTAATRTCHRTATEKEYAAVVAQCKKAAEAYQQHADAFRQDYEKLTAEIAAYDAGRQRLQAEQEDLEKKRQDNQARLASLQSERAEAAGRYNEIRDRLMAAAPKSN